MTAYWGKFEKFEVLIVFWHAILLSLNWKVFQTLKCSLEIPESIIRYSDLIGSISHLHGKRGQVKSLSGIPFNLASLCWGILVGREWLPTTVATLWEQICNTPKMTDEAIGCRMTCSFPY